MNRFLFIFLPLSTTYTPYIYQAILEKWTRSLLLNIKIDIKSSKEKTLVMSENLCEALTYLLDKILLGSVPDLVLSVCCLVIRVVNVLLE